ncbi:MAG: NAD(+) synthase [Tenacibaculum sp.]
MNTPKVVNHIVNWLKEYALNAKVDGFVIGISGGIDSAVSSVLCAKTALPVLAVKLPIYQCKNQLNLADKHCEQLKASFSNVKDIELSLNSTFDAFKKVLPKIKPSAKKSLALANTRARLRMTALYYFAGLHNFLVVGTGNKVEDFGVGFFTKYGDGGVDLSPIADLLKSEVYQLADYLHISESIQRALPTDGLFGDNRTDEEQIGASYNELEWAMQMQQSGKNVDNFIGREQQVYKIYTHLNSVNQHKMLPIPVCKIPKKFKIK